MKINYLREGGGKLVVASLFSFIAGQQDIFAQPNTEIALGQTTVGIARYVPVMQSLCYAIAAIIAVVSTAIVYLKMNAGNDSIKKPITLAFGSCVFLTCSATALPMFFGLDTSKDNGMSKDFMHEMDIWEPGDIGFGTAPDGTIKAFLVADEGTKLFSGTLGAKRNESGMLQATVVADDGTMTYFGGDLSGFGRGTDYVLKLGKAPDGTYRYYIGNGADRVWHTNGIPRGNRNGNQLGKDENGIYRWYAIADDGAKIWGAKFNEGHEDHYRVSGFDSNSNTGYIIADDGAKLYHDRPLNWYEIGYAVLTNPNSKYEKVGDVVRNYIIADNGKKVYGFDYPSQYSLEGPHVLVGVKDGEYRNYIITDKGEKVWGDKVNG